MKRRLLLVGIFLALLVLIGVLAPDSRVVPLQVKVLHRTNDPVGHTRYVISVTNLTRDMFLVQCSKDSFTNQIWDPALPSVTGGMYWFGGFDLPGHRARVIACEPLPGPHRPVALWYQRSDSKPRWYQAAREWIRARLGIQRMPAAAPQKLFFDLPAE